MSIISGFRRWCQSLTMQMKMFLAYTSAMIAIVAAVLLLAAPLYMSFYSRQWNYSIRQSLEQSKAASDRQELCPRNTESSLSCARY